MSIYHLKGDKVKCEAEANTLRNSAISGGRGALIMRAGEKAEARYLLEKIIVAEIFQQGKKTVDEIPWKPKPDIIFVNEGISRLTEFEKLVPGFQRKFGPTVTERALL